MNLELAKLYSGSTSNAEIIIFASSCIAVVIIAETVLDYHEQCVPPSIRQCTHRRHGSTNMPGCFLEVHEIRHVLRRISFCGHRNYLSFGCLIFSSKPDVVHSRSQGSLRNRRLAITLTLLIILLS